MDHEQVREQLELAAVEPEGLERLMAGDTANAMAVAGHIAGCPSCAGELQRLTRAVPLLRDVVRTTPPADLRERTLAFVWANGVPRGADAGIEAAGSAFAPPVALHPSVVTPFPGGVDAAVGTTHAGDDAASEAAPPGLAPDGADVADEAHVGPAGLARDIPPPSRPIQAAAASSTGPSSVAPRNAAPGNASRGLLPWVAAIAAAVVLSVAATSFLLGSRIDAQFAAQSQQIEGLETVTLATIDITAEPDTARVSLASTDGTPTAGNILFSPSRQQLVVVATGLTTPPSGQEYRCWIERDGSRTSIGKMFFADDLAYWVGDTPSIADAPPGSTFGVSLTDIGGTTPNADPVIVGQL